jgi:hypothetical protein
MRRLLIKYTLPLDGDVSDFDNIIASIVSAHGGTKTIESGFYFSTRTRDIGALVPDGTLDDCLADLAKNGFVTEIQAAA